ncbi:MAG: hypothetical protein AAGM67_17210, partial [Bacteroidota bacterium]
MLELIERGGGIKRCNGADHHLRFLLNSDEDKFGKQSHNIRRRIQQKVYKWQKAPYREYSKVLQNFGVAPFAERFTTDIEQEVDTIQDNEDDDGSISSKSTSEEGS